VGVIALLAIAGAIFAVLRGHGTPVSTPPSTSASPPAAHTTTPAVNPVSAGPGPTVQAYIAAINAHRYQKAWDLGGSNTGKSYSSFVQGFNGTAHDTLTITSVSGNVVTAQLDAVQTDGTVKHFQGTYTVSNGIITSFDIHRAS
jgi:hypothetical protein